MDLAAASIDPYASNLSKNFLESSNKINGTTVNDGDVL